MTLVSVILSFRNEEQNIPELVRRVTDAFSGLALDHEMIFINDCSTDRSLEILTELAAHNKRIRVVNTSRRCGPSPCVLAGLVHASGAAAICLDSDLQDPPELIPKLIREWQDGADVVHTTRLSRAGESRFKLLITHIAYRIINKLSDTDIPADTGDCKLLSRRVVEELIRLNEYDPFLRGLVCWVGFKQTRIFYDREPRMAGRTNMPLLSRGPVRAFVSGITSFSSYPLYFSLLMGILISVAALFYIVIVLVTTMVFGMNNPGWPSLMVAILLLGGMTLMSNGVTGIYVGRIHRQVKQRPLWIVESYVNCERPAITQPAISEYERGFNDGREASAQTTEKLLGPKTSATEAVANRIRSILPDDASRSARSAAILEIQRSPKGSAR